MMKTGEDSVQTVSFPVISTHPTPFLCPLPLPNLPSFPFSQQSPPKKKASSSKASAQDDLLLLFDDVSSSAPSSAQHAGPLTSSVDHMLTPMTAALSINGGGSAGTGGSGGKRYKVHVQGELVHRPHTKGMCVRESLTSILALRCKQCGYSRLPCEPLIPCCTH